MPPPGNQPPNAGAGYQGQQQQGQASGAPASNDLNSLLAMLVSDGSRDACIQLRLILLSNPDGDKGDEQHATGMPVLSTIVYDANHYASAR